MILDVLLWFFLAYRNSVRAKLKGEKPLLWGFFTVLAVFALMLIGSTIVVLNFCKNINIIALSSTDKKTRDALTLQLMETLKNNPLDVVTIYLFGFGGYLLVRYILDRKPNKKETEMHWMDRLGDGTNQ